ncbi:MAG: aminotransferase class V-fold PLP-dependent enzyme [Paludisphaera borealis]|uniref:aminotransferase class V-fold PLP-dependent enzyme n=1 Tax=Paludisphaera borealis TaxID=1387353 RepID=UPI0028515605|nr:aminotransferase class V-fold PLP-dependent enzyme [Paludisphaera borealis]MDR3621624.1 aminotransferase class V-fold PLP-dependent enzyme [Paludisphaera borealis]
METYWETLRDAEFPVARNWAYLDHAAVAPLPRRSAMAIRAWADDQAENGAVDWPSWERKVEALRDGLAAWIGADRDEVAFVSSTTHGIGLVAEGFPWNEGDNVVVPAEEYPSNIYPWMNLASRGVAVRLVPTRDDRVWIEDLRDAMDARTRMLAVSHVEFASGFRNDLDALGELCRSRGVAFFVDAIQGLGPFEIDLARTPIDFLAADGHKWLLGPEGAGFLYVRRDWIERLRPLGVGWHSVVGSFNSPEVAFRLKPNSQRWEGGSFVMPGLQGLAASMSLLGEIGSRAVSERILDRAEAVREAAALAGWSVLGSNRPADRSAIVAVAAEGVDPQAAVRSLRSKGVVAACRRGRLRISPHVYTNDDDVRRLREALAACRRRDEPRADGPEHP